MWRKKPGTNPSSPRVRGYDPNGGFEFQQHSDGDPRFEVPGLSRKMSHGISWAKQARKAGPVPEGTRNFVEFYIGSEETLRA